MLDEEDVGRFFLGGFIGSAIGFVWALITIYALFAKNSFSELWFFLSYPITYIVQRLSDWAVDRELFSVHDLIGTLVFLVFVSVLLGFVIGGILSVCVGHALTKLTRRP